jgi:hypothetical protein
VPIKKSKKLTIVGGAFGALKIGNYIPLYFLLIIMTNVHYSLIGNFRDELAIS